MTGNPCNRSDRARGAWLTNPAIRIAGWGPLVFSGLVWAVLGHSAEQTAASAGRPAAPATEFRGAGSCSAVACHGSIAPQPGQEILRNEHTTWISEDDHSRAFQVLFDERSQRIARNLGSGLDSSVPAHEDERCLACHTTPRSKPALAATPWMNSDGVGCESCHGASAHWLGRHTTSAWKQINDPREKRAHGLVDTKDLVHRATVCTGCHVGQRSHESLLDRDVNHDLIAAGHPRLNFELSAFLDRMPAHWKEKNQNADRADPRRRAANFPARAWALGRLVTLRSSIELLSARSAAAVDHAVPWPEFTEYGCFSCHHSLRDEAWRRRQNAAVTPIGAARWGTWTTPLLGELLGPVKPLTDEASARESLESLSRLAALMAPAVPNPALVQRASHLAAEKLDRSIAGLAEARFDAEQVERLITALDGPEAWDRVASWDEATVRYLALVPLRQAWSELAPTRKADQDKLAIRLEAVRSKLYFPAGYDSPSGFDPGKLRMGR
jgi:hypothetical protein